MKFFKNLYMSKLDFHFSLSYKSDSRTRGASRTTEEISFDWSNVIEIAFRLLKILAPIIIPYIFN
jgi:hypothetical protein